MIISSNKDRERIKLILEKMSSNDNDQIRYAIKEAMEILRSILNGPFYYNELIRSQPARYVNSLNRDSSDLYSAEFVGGNCSVLIKTIFGFLIDASPDFMTERAKRITNEMIGSDTPATLSEDENEDEDEYEDDEEEEEEDTF